MSTIFEQNSKSAKIKLHRNLDFKDQKESIKRKMKNVWLVFLYRIGLNPDRLAKMYYFDD